MHLQHPTEDPPSIDVMCEEVKEIEDLRSTIEKLRGLIQVTQSTEGKCDINILHLTRRFKVC